MLQGISTDEDELKDVFGVQYQILLQALRVESINQTSAPPTSTGGRQPASAQPTHSELSGQKRKRVPSPTEIIDLT